jgi:hypothetical protein
MLAHQLRASSPATGTAFSGAGELMLEKFGGIMMNANQNALRSGSAAIVFFTALSSISASATALLPFLAHA